MRATSGGPAITARTETEMHIKNEKDFWSGFLFIAIGIGFAWGATHYRFGTSVAPGPGYFPFGLGMLISMVGAVVLIKSLARRSSDEARERLEPIVWKPLLIIIGSVVVFGFTLPHLGLFIALPLLVLSSAFAGDQFRMRDVFVNALILTVGCWAVFVLGLGLLIPLLPKFLN